jgi:hypothetical protein
MCNGGERKTSREVRALSHSSVSAVKRAISDGIVPFSLFSLKSLATSNTTIQSTQAWLKTRNSGSQSGELC